MTGNPTMIRHIPLMLALLMLFASVSWAWEYSGAIGEVCFNVTNGGTIFGKLDYSNWYTIMNVTLEKNGTFWNNTIRGYYPATGQSIDVFKYAENSTHVFLIIPAMDSLVSTASDRYCIYVGDDNESDVRDIAPTDMAFDVQSDIKGASYFDGIGSYVLTWNGSLATLATNSSVAYKPSSYSGFSNVFMIGKFRDVGNSGKYANGMGTGLITPDLGPASFYSSGIFIGSQNSTAHFSWYTFYNNSGYLNPANDTFNIYTLSYSPSSGRTRGAMFNESMSLVNSTNFTAHTYDGGNIAYTFPMFANNSTVEYDWVLGGYTDGNNNFSTTNVVFDIQDPNITIINPIWDSSYDSTDAIIAQIIYNNNFNNCTIFINDVEYKNYTNVTSGYVSTDIVDSTNVVSGSNNLTVYCNFSGTITHRYTYFSVTGSDVDSFFSDAFGFNVSDTGCGPTDLVAIGTCIESYNLSTLYDFAAVVCKSTNTSHNFTCMSNTTVYGVRNVTKGIYTIFYRPATRDYPGSGGVANIERQTLGANFIYSGTHLEPGFEILDNRSFVYMPAQIEAYDCSIYWENPGHNCSYSHGFVVNNATTAVSDRMNNWYTANGPGVTQYDGNMSSVVTTYNVYSIISGQGGGLFSKGIYTRLNCYEKGGYYIVRITNTLPQNYTVTMLGNGTSFALSSSQLIYNTSLAGVTNIIVSDGSETLCEYPVATTLFLPFNLPSDFVPDGYDIIIWATMLFSVVLTAMVPFAAIIVLILNDLYHVLTNSDISLVIMLAMVFGFVNNSFNMERGIKHLLIILGLATAYLAAVSPYAEDNGVDLNGFDAPMKAFAELADANTIESFVFAIPNFIINLFWLLLTLPVTLMTLLLSLIKIISPPLYTAAKSISPFITVGVILYFYLKAYEVLANRFRPV